MESQLQQQHAEVLAALAAFEPMFGEPDSVTDDEDAMRHPICSAFFSFFAQPFSTHCLATL